MGPTVVQIDKKMKGRITTAHSAITATATSDIIDCRGKNALLVEFVITGAANWTISIQGSLTKTGTYCNIYELANTGSMAQMSYQLNSNRLFIFKGIPDWIKVVATEDADGQTVTVRVQPIVV